MKKSRSFLVSFFVTFLVVCFMSTVDVGAASASDSVFQSIAEVSISANGIAFMPKVTYARLNLSVSIPDGTVFSKTFEAGSSPYLRLSELSENYPPDGLYTYELWTVTVVGQRVRKSLEKAGLEKEKELIQEPLVQNGYFSVREGMIVTSNAPERGVSITQEGPAKVLDEVIYDDLIVDGSLCVGNDCYSGLAFGFDTIVLMENNLRIYFDDTSNTSSFPNNDWRIVINDTTDGGGEYFALQDVSGGLTPFTIEAGAKTNSLYVDDDGQVGIGTSGPVYELHIKEGDTPTVRLHQSTAYGWPEQIWDVGGNETSFFVRDGTHAAKLPFRIEPETPSSTLCLKSDGKVGVGTWSPGYRFEVETTGANAEIVADRTDGARNFMNATTSNAVFGSINNYPVRIVTNNSWRMQLNTDNSLSMRSGASCTSGGEWTNASSIELKENIQTLTTDEAMDTLKGLNPVKYNYKVDKEEKHVGFISEKVPDLVATKDRKGMSPMDVVAVLTKVVQEQQKTISELKKEIAELKKK